MNQKTGKKRVWKRVKNLKNWKKAFWVIGQKTQKIYWVND